MVQTDYIRTSLFTVRQTVWIWIGFIVGMSSWVRKHCQRLPKLSQLWNVSETKQFETFSNCFVSVSFESADSLPSSATWKRCNISKTVDGPVLYIHATSQPTNQSVGHSAQSDASDYMVVSWSAACAVARAIVPIKSVLHTQTTTFCTDHHHGLYFVLTTESKSRSTDAQ